MRAIWICHRVQTRLWDFAAGRLPAAETERVTLHLQRCAACRGELERARRIVPAIMAQTLDLIPASETDFADVVRRIEMRHAVSAQTRKQWRFEPVVPLVAVATLTFFMVVKSQVRRAAIEPSLQRATRQVAMTKVIPPAISYPPKPLPVAGTTLSRQLASAVVPYPPSRLLFSEGARHEESAPVPAAPMRLALLTRIGPSGPPARRLRRRQHRAPHVSRRGDEETSPTMAPIVPVGNMVTGGDDGDDPRQPERTFVLPTVGQDTAIPRTFVIDNIPVTDLAGQAGSAAAQNLKAGKAL